MDAFDQLAKLGSLCLCEENARHSYHGRRGAEVVAVTIRNGYLRSEYWLATNNVEAARVIPNVEVRP